MGTEFGRFPRNHKTIKNLVNIIDVNIDVRIPIANVTANPFIGPEPNE